MIESSILKKEATKPIKPPRKMTYAESLSIMLLAIDKAGLHVLNKEVATSILQGKKIHPMNFASLEREVANTHNQSIRHCNNLIEKCNKFAECIAADFCLE